MIPSYSALAPGYDKLWAELIPDPARIADLDRVCDGLRAHRATYEQASTAVWGKPDFWWYVGITDQMEGGGGARTYLGNGQPLDRVTTEVPAGRGPFPNFVAGAVDALRGIPAPTSVSQAAYNWEGYNGWGYLNKPIEDPYLASYSNKYVKGKWVADHVYNPEAVSQQPGALTILKVLMPAGPGATPSAPPAPQVPPAAPPAQPPIITPKGHIMIDVTTIVNELNVGLAVAEKIETVVAMFDPPVASYILAALKGIRSIETSLGLPTGEPAATTAGLFDTRAVTQATDHVTPGAPNAPALSPKAP